MHGSTTQLGSGDFRIDRLLWWATVVECVILGVGGVGLLVLPDLITPLWPWPLAQFTVRALGAVYSAAFVVVLALAVRPWWSPARVVVPMVAVFTAIVTVLSVAHLDRLANWPWTGVWLMVYLGAATIALGYAWRYRGIPPAPTARPPDRLLRAALVAEIALLGGYGVALLVVGAPAVGFWPWPIDSVYASGSADLHARIYSAAFITPAVGAALLVRLGTVHEDRTLGASQLVSGIAAVAGVVVVDASVHRVDWGLPGTWAWVAMCAAIAGVGGLLLRGRTA